MQYNYTRPLNDKELAGHLIAQDQIILRVPVLRWQDVERQVDRLGFGESFLVSETKSSRGQCCRIEPVRSHGFPEPRRFKTQVRLNG
jgi:hypothetical protein